jgi:hypothetical protein
MTTASSLTLPTNPAPHCQSTSATSAVGSVSVPPVSTASSRPPRPSHHYNVPFLDNNGSNYASWKFCIETTLDLHEIWSVVNGTSTKPDPAMDPDRAEEWRWKNKEVFIQITMMLKDKPLNSIIGSKSAKEAWDKLCVQYKGLSKQRIIHLLHDVFCISKTWVSYTALYRAPQSATVCHSITVPTDRSGSVQIPTDPDRA